MAALDSPYGTSDSSQSWSYRLHCLLGACRDLERLPHHSLPPKSNDGQRSPAGSADSIADSGRGLWLPQLASRDCIRSIMYKRRLVMAPIRLNDSLIVFNSFPPVGTRRLAWRTDMIPIAAISAKDPRRWPWVCAPERGARWVCRAIVQDR